VYVVAGLVDSLENPNFVAEARGSWLVEVKVFDRRIGYFVATRVVNSIVVRTFLFLTMEGTPESQLLKQNLRFKRADITQLHLHELKTFLYTDLQKDSKLVHLFEECGCGHLLTLRSRDSLDTVAAGQAELVRKYLHPSVFRSSNAWGRVLAKK